MFYLGVIKEHQWFSFPVKHNWYEHADLKLIERSAKELVDTIDDIFLDPDDRPPTIYLPRPGCGNGRLKWEDVKPVIEPYLDDRFVVVTL